MTRPLLLHLLLVVGLVASSVATAQDVPARTDAGVLQGTDTFPIAVWLQSPQNAARYRDLGINLYVALWKGPTEAQLAALEEAGMSVICEQNEEALKPRWEKLVVGWMHGDEPDNAQSLGKGKGYGPPIPPQRIVDDYHKLKGKDPRPVLLNLGQGVAWDGWYGRGERTNKPEDYPQYIKGGDIISFDIYPAVHKHRDVAGKLWYVGRGVERLMKWTDGRKPVWSCIECTHIDNAEVKPTPQQVKAEVWMAIIHGARGIIYFSHQFAPRFIEAGLLADVEMTGAVRAINREVQDLAIVISQPPATGPATVRSSGGDAGRIALMTRHHAGATYTFAVGMSDQAVTGTFSVGGSGKTIEVLGEGRSLTATNGTWSDQFRGYEVHLYRIGQ